MITPRFFDQELAEQARVQGPGTTVVTVHLAGGLQHRVKAVRRADHEYVLLDVYRKRGADGAADTIAVAYEVITHVVVSAQDSEEAERFAFVTGD